MQRISEPYGYDPLQEWVLDNDQIHYTSLALQEGYSIDVNTGEFFNPDGELVANDPAVWELVVIPQVLDDYVASKRSELQDQWVDFGVGLVFGTKLTKNFGIFAEGKYNRYWNREWHDFSIGLNYILL